MSSKWLAEPYIAEDVAWVLEADTREDAIREAEELRSEIHIKYYIYEEH